jgi:hypothetical protein
MKGWDVCFKVRVGRESCPAGWKIDMYVCMAGGTLRVQGYMQRGD